MDLLKVKDSAIAAGSIGLPAASVYDTPQSALPAECNEEKDICFDGWELIEMEKCVPEETRLCDLCYGEGYECLEWPIESCFDCIARRETVAYEEMTVVETEWIVAYDKCAEMESGMSNREINKSDELTACWVEVDDAQAVYESYELYYEACQQDTRNATMSKDWLYQSLAFAEITYYEPDSGGFEVDVFEKIPEPTYQPDPKQYAHDHLNDPYEMDSYEVSYYGF